MSPAAPITDEDLTAFLDGELDAARRAEIDRALADDPALQARLGALAASTLGIREAFDGLLSAAPAEPAELRVAPPPEARPTRAWRGLALAASIAALACLSLGWWAGGGSSQAPRLVDWRDYAAAYHALYVPETLDHAALAPDERDAQLARAAAALGAPLDAIAEPVDGVVLRRAQILGFENRPIIQLAYQNADGVPIALCLTRQTQPRDRALTLETRHDMASASWARDGLSYMVIGGDDAALLKRWAETVAARL